MSIRRNLVVYLALFIALGGTSYAATQLARVQRGCYPRGSVTIAQDKAGRFYSRTIRRSAGRAVTYWYVCSFKQGTPRTLRFKYPPAGAVPVDRSAKVSGRYVAFLVVCRGCVRAPAVGAPVVVFDMVTGQRTFATGFTTGNIDVFVLKPDGSVAWITADRFNPTWEVSRHDSTGTAVVDSGPGIDPRSLAAGGSWLYWTVAGSPRSASFH